MKITALIAAAGRSTRMGTPKALLTFDGTTFIRRTVQRFVEAKVEKIIVTLPECDSTRECIKSELQDFSEITYLENAFPKHELLGSAQSVIANGVKQPSSSRIRKHGLLRCTRNDGSPATLDALLVMPVDVPAPSLDFLRLFFAASIHAPHILCTIHAGQLGHPILFTHHFFDEILQLKSGDTLRTVLNRHQDQIVTIESNDSNVICNINTPSDYARFTNPSAKYFEAAATQAPGAKER